MESPVVEGQWVCYVRGKGTVAPADQCPPDEKLYWQVDNVRYDSPEAYTQMQEQRKLDSIAEKATFAERPDGYPVCTCYGGPFGPGEADCVESCEMHTILWLQRSGFTYRQAIELTAVYNRLDDWGHGPVVEKLGGMDEFNEITSEDPENVEKLSQWLEANQALVYYFMETYENSPDGLWMYWWHSKDPEHYKISKWLEIGVMVEVAPDGSYNLWSPPGYPILIPRDEDGRGEWFKAVDQFANATPHEFLTSSGFWANHHYVHANYRLDSR